jgi:hypothetical protein
MENGQKTRIAESLKRAKKQTLLFLNMMAQGLVNDLKTAGRQKAAKDASALTTAITHFHILR